MGYRVHRENDTYKIVEVNKGEVKDVERGCSEARAKEISKNLNMGGAFDGNTPDFFLNRFEVSV